MGQTEKGIFCKIRHVYFLFVYIEFSHWIAIQGLLLRSPSPTRCPSSDTGTVGLMAYLVVHRKVADDVVVGHDVHGRAVERLEHVACAQPRPVGHAVRVRRYNHVGVDGTLGNRHPEAISSRASLQYTLHHLVLL